MYLTDAPAGWIFIGTAMIWAGKGVRALIASRRRAAPSGHGQRVQKWQWFGLAATQVTLGVWFVTDPSKHEGLLWWLIAGFGCLAHLDGHHRRRVVAEITPDRHLKSRAVIADRAWST
jgi:hypothetical protein